jgi:hypothetical protein
MAAKIFTLEEANQLIPQLRAILTRIMEKRDQIATKQKEVYAIRRIIDGNGHNPEALGLAAKERELKELINELNEDIEKINSLGCELKDIHLGLVDFRSIREGREVYLCWKFDEDEISFWHDLHTGFAGRQPLF